MVPEETISHVDVGIQVKVSIIKEFKKYIDAAANANNFELDLNFNLD